MLLQHITHFAWEGKKSFALEIIHATHGGFKVTRKWICQFLRQCINWTFKMITIAINILLVY